MTPQVVDMKIKTSELTGAALDWAVAKCEGYTPHDDYGIPKLVTPGGSGVMLDVLGRPGYYHMRRYSTDWSQGGPIIERECISIEYMDRGYFRCRKWRADKRVYTEYHYSNNTSPLIAAMRCYVASKLGDEIEIPEELL